MTTSLRESGCDADPDSRLRGDDGRGEDGGCRASGVSRENAVIHPQSLPRDLDGGNPSPDSGRFEPGDSSREAARRGCDDRPFGVDSDPTDRRLAEKGSASR